MSEGRISLGCDALLHAGPLPGSLRVLLNRTSGPHRLVRPRTQGFHPWYAGSNPAGDALSSEQTTDGDFPRNFVALSFGGLGGRKRQRPVNERLQNLVALVGAAAQKAAQIGEAGLSLLLHAARLEVDRGRRMLR